MRKSKSDKEIDRQIEAAYYRHGQGVQIDIMNIEAIFREGRAALAAGQDLDAAMPEIIARYREN